jgi:uncharacterized membrane protein
MNPVFSKYTKKFFSYFLQGLLYITPLGATVFVIYITFNFIDGTANSILESLFEVKIPGLGIVLMLSIIAGIGYFGKTIFAHPLILLVDTILDRVPFLKIIYSSTKDFMSAFVGQKKKFTEAVMVRMNKDTDIYKLGFITQRDLTQIGITEGYVAVYLPHSYNFSGNLFIVPVENVTAINAPSTEIMKFIVSGGVTEINKKAENEEA